jgi:ABC-type uncharacterized transport system auxiliary subunit
MRIGDLKTLKSCLAGVAAALLCASCASLKQPYPDKTYFAIDPGAPAGPISVPTTSQAIASYPVILVRRLSVASPYDEPLFVYKTGTNKFEKDYYNAFIAEPASLLTDDLLKWLSAEKSIGSVVAGGSSARHDLTLESNITSLYADLEKKNAPTVTVEGRFMLIDDRNRDAIVLDKTYSVSVSATSDRPADLAVGWGAAYHQILDSLAEDLSKREN